MHSISDQTALDVWDVGSTRHALDRNLLLLAGAEVDAFYQLQTLDVQQRDRLLLEVRRNTFGDRMELLSECRHCAAELEIEISTTAMLAVEPASSHEIDVDGWHLEFRLPTSVDLAAAVETGADIFVSCIQICRADGFDRDPGELPTAIRQTVEDAMAKAAPAADIELMVDCAECGETEALTFDIGQVLWREVAARAQQLLAEIVVLARAFGWNEPTILALSPQRRRAYLEAVT